MWIAIAGVAIVTSLALSSLGQENCMRSFVVESSGGSFDSPEQAVDEALPGKRGVFERRVTSDGRVVFEKRDGDRVKEAYFYVRWADGNWSLDEAQEAVRG